MHGPVAILHPDNCEDGLSGSMVMAENESGAAFQRGADLNTAAATAGPMAGSAAGTLDSQAGDGARAARLPAIGARMGKDPPEHGAAKNDDKGSGAEQSKGQSRPRAKGGRSSTAFDLWLQRELQDMFADVSREPVPDELMRLIDESKAKK